MIAFTVYGKPATKGSFRVFRAKSGAPIVRKDTDATYAFEGDIRERAVREMLGVEPTEKPVRVHLGIRIQRPKSHFRTGKHAGELKPDAPTACTTTPDCDKVARAVFDAMQGVVYRNDSQIVELTLSKLYAERPCVHIEVRW